MEKTYLVSGKVSHLEFLTFNFDNDFVIVNGSNINALEINSNTILTEESVKELVDELNELVGRKEFTYKEV